MFDEEWTSTGAKLDAVDSHSGALSTIFDLLKDGASHTFYFFFWVNQANNAVISVVQLWEGAGATCSTSSLLVATLTYTGLLNIGFYPGKIGTGTYRQTLIADSTLFGSNYAHWVFDATDVYAPIPQTLCLIEREMNIFLKTSVATDIVHIYGFYAILRSEL